MICFYKERDEISVLWGKLHHCFCAAWRASRNLVISFCSFWGMQRKVSKSIEKSVVINVTKEHPCCRRRRRCCCYCFVLFCFLFLTWIWAKKSFSLPYMSSARRSNRSSLCLILGLNSLRWLLIIQLLNLQTLRALHCHFSVDWTSLL